MQHARPILFALFPLLVLALVTGGCGGGGDDDAGGFPFGEDQDDGGSGNDDGGGGGTGGTGDDTDDDNGDDDSGSGGSTSFGDPELTAEPGQAWAEVEGERLEYEVNGSQFYACDIGADQIQVNTQTPDGRDLVLGGNRQGDMWFGRVTFFRQVDGTRVQYSGDLFVSGVRFGLSETALDFEGTVTKIEGTDIQNAEDLEARLAINCDTGDAPVAEIDGQTIEVPFSGSQHVVCEVSEEEFEIDIGAHQDGRSLEINGRTEGGMLIGSVSIRTAETNYSSTFPNDREGLEVDGTTIRYEGTFVKRSTDEEMVGSVVASCP